MLWGGADRESGQQGGSPRTDHSFPYHKLQTGKLLNQISSKTFLLPLACRMNYEQPFCFFQEELCWAGNSRLDIEVMENSREVLGAWLGFQLNSCETGIRVDYEMNMNSGSEMDARNKKKTGIKYIWLCLCFRSRFVLHWARSSRIFPILI